MGIWVIMKTTIEMPDTLFRKIKSVSASKGMSLKDFITDALKAKLAVDVARGDDDLFLIGFGAFSSTNQMRNETKVIQKKIDEEFSLIDPQEWK